MPPEITFLPDGTKVHVRPGTTLLDAARRAKINIRTRCGGKAACLMCKVKVENPSSLAPMKNNERLKLGGLENQGFRLACQACAVSNTTVEVPEDPLKAVIRAQLAKQREEEEGI